MAKLILPAVYAHLPLVQKVRDELGLPANRYPDALVLSFIHYESKGDVQAVSPSGRHFGILQCMDAYVVDACSFGKRTPFPSRELLGDPERSIWVFFQYMERYKSVHQYSPTMMAVLHKGGVGTAQRVQGSKLPLDEAIIQVEKTYLSPKGNPYAPNLHKYVSDFRGVFTNYVAWVEAQNAPFVVCDPKVVEFPKGKV
jgi:hypothetical protein